MEQLTGLKLIEITKQINQSTLIFEGKNEKKFILTFEGTVFETINSSLGKKVQYSNTTSNLGFKGICYLRKDSKNIEEYQQLFLQMDGDSNDENKTELICIVKNCKFEKLWVLHNGV